MSLTGVICSSLGAFRSNKFDLISRQCHTIVLIHPACVPIRSVYKHRLGLSNQFITTSFFSFLLAVLVYSGVLVIVRQLVVRRKFVYVCEVSSVVLTIRDWIVPAVFVVPVLFPRSRFLISCSHGNCVVRLFAFGKQFASVNFASHRWYLVTS